MARKTTIPECVLRKSIVQGGLTSTSPLGRKFMDIWQRLKGPELVAEVKFAESRKFRFDFAHLGSRVAIELHGGEWIAGRHVRPKGFASDCEKFRLAARLGWLVFPFVDSQITAEEVEKIMVTIEIRGER